VQELVWGVQIECFRMCFVVFGDMTEESAVDVR
jgi:hypothetical protein